MVKPLRFKGDPKPKKRKRVAASENDDKEGGGKPSCSQTPAAAAATEEAEDNMWVSADVVSDVIGPIMIVLPTKPPTALACDGAGKVYQARIENVVDGMVAASAEPHNVQMVWVANKVAGSDNAVRFKSHNGKLLGVDKSGLLSATSEVMSSFESFSILSFPLDGGDNSGKTTATAGTGSFLIRSAAGQYVLVAKAGVVGDADAAGDDLDERATVVIRMQARFKPRLQAAKAERLKEKISRKELEGAVGRRLEDDEVKTLKRARKEGDYHEKLLDLKVKGKHDKYG